MKNWKEHAHLFANGKFHYKTKRGFVDKIRSYYDLREKTGNNKAYGFNTMTRIHKIEALIARKIEDMTDEEVKEMYSISGNSVESLKQMRDFTETKANKVNLKFPEAIYLLSIGVYPFDQSHFEDGTVLDINS